MKTKKFLEQVAEEDREALVNDRDIEFLESIGVDYNKKSAAAKESLNSSYYRTKSAVNYRAVLVSVASLIVAFIAVALILFYTLKPAPFESPIEYFEANEVDVPSDLQELNSDLKLFSLTVDTSEYGLKTTRIYDELSEDNLYYMLEFTATGVLNKKFTLDVVVNSNYKHKELEYTDFKEAQISNYKMKYSEYSVPFNPPFSRVNCTGEIQIGEQWIYITDYTETAIGQGTFIETLQSIITFN